MDSKHSAIDARLAAITWGLLLVWWGLADSDFGLIRSLPAGAGWIGIGLILLGLNAARLMYALPARGFTLALALFALGVGGIKLARSLLGLAPIEIPLFPLLLVGFGIYLLVRQLKPDGDTAAGCCGSHAAGGEHGS